MLSSIRVESLVGQLTVGLLRLWGLLAVEHGGLESLRLLLELVIWVHVGRWGRHIGATLIVRLLFLNL